MENSTNNSQQKAVPDVPPSWAHGGAGVYSALVFLIVAGLCLIQLFDCKRIKIQFLLLRIMLSRYKNFVLDMLYHFEVVFFNCGYQRGGKIQINRLTLGGRHMWAYKEGATHVLPCGEF